jgi:hypothetical protein
MKRALAGAAVVTIAAMIPAAAAQAASRTVVDATGDTWTTDYDGTTATDISAGSQVNVDLARTVIKYAGRKVVVNASYAELDRGTNWFQLGLRLRTNEGLKRLAVVDTMASQDWDGAHALGTPKGDEVSCKGMSHVLDYDANTVRLVIPASCLSKPRWIQAYIGADGYAATAEQPMTLTHDNGLADTWAHTGWTGKIRKG